MASHIPTRRPVRRADENAPPATSTLPTTRAKAALAPSAIPVRSTLPSNLPVMKRQMSNTMVSAKPDSIAAGKKRSALGEVTNAGKTGVKGKDGKVKEERKPLARQDAPVQPTRRTRSSNEAKTEAVLPKRKSTVPARPTIDRSRSTTASTSAIPPPQASRLHAKEIAEPARKKRKTSSPTLDDEDEDLDEALFDEDGKEVVLSSGGRGVRMQSPKRERAKDEGWTDLDAEDEGDPAMVAEYVVDAFKYMFAIEKNTVPDPDYMTKQTELHWKMRSILMDWLVEVHQKFRLLPETLFIAVNLIDRFLSLRVVSMVKLQLVGLTGLFIAAKYEEVICPSITHFLHMTEGGYGIEEILKAERYMLSTLEFDLSYPNPLHFLRRVSKADGYDIQTRTVAKYLVEISCVEHRLLAFSSSLLSAAGMWLARLCLDRGDWEPNLVHYSGYAVEELLEPAQIMLDYVLDPEFNEDSAFHKKYASKKHMKASIYVRGWASGRWPESAKGKGPFKGCELRQEVDDALPATP